VPEQKDKDGHLSPENMQNGLSLSLSGQMCKDLLSGITNLILEMRTAVVL
jgi:hypothetical protein